MQDNDWAPPPYLSGNINNEETSLTIYSSATMQPSTSASSHIAQILTVRSSKGHRVRYSISVPKKREGWKAEVFSISEKDRQELRYEVRREPLSRRFDFRDPEGNHNVMIPSNSLAQKSYLLETPDGQKLTWKRGNAGWGLYSLPSQTIIAQYTTVKGRHHQQSKGDQLMLGGLEIMTLPIETEPMLFNKRRRTNTNLTSSSSSSEEGPRLGKDYQRCSVGLCIPAAIIAAVASPYASASMSRNSILGDELANLGRANIKPVVQIETSDTMQISGTSWLQMGENAIRKNDDPRPRGVDLDLIMSSFVAVLTG